MTGLLPRRPGSMQPAATHRVLILTLWGLFLAVAALAAARARYSADLSAFLPRSPSATQRLLVDQVREGLVSRLITLRISGADGASRAQLSQAMANALAGDARFAAINNGSQAADLNNQRFLIEHRYLLSEAVTPERFTAAGLRAAISATLDELASPAGMIAKPLLTRDPTGELLQVIDQIDSGATPRKVAGVWSTRDGQHALLTAQTRAQGSDTDAQEQALLALRAAFEAARSTLPPPARGQVSLTLTGPPVFAVEARARIKSEVIRLTSLSAASVMLLLLLVYRSGAALALGLTPVVCGALAGILAVSLGFGVVHGITLGFGITLIGEVVDYSIYLLVQARERTQTGHWQRSMWPTVRLGMLTSVAGFASLVPSGFPGLAQLGVYSISGLLTGAAVTRFVLPALMPARLAIRDLTPLGAWLTRLQPRLAALAPALLAVPLVAAVVLISHRDRLFSHELSSLSAVSQQAQTLDGQLHADLGAPDAGFLVAVEGPDRESVLAAAGQAGARLAALQDRGVIGGFASPARFLPSRATQEQRRASLPPAPELSARLRQGLAGLPLEIERLQPFMDDVAQARSAPLLEEKDLAGTAFGAATQALLFASAGTWHALLPLTPPQKSAGAADGIDLTAVQQALTGTPGKPLVLGLKAEADRLYAGYLREVISFSLSGALAIVLLLLIALKDVKRVARTVAPLILAVLTVAAALSLAGQPLTLLHIIGMLLIVAVGSNYALFFDHQSQVSESQGAQRPQLTLASLLVANLATVLAFGVLAFARVPVLAALGQTVAPGTLLALLYAATLARPAQVAQAGAS